MNQELPLGNPNTTSKPCSRIGWIVEVHPEKNRVKVGFENNPFSQPVWASLGRAFTQSEIFMAIDNKLDCRISFLSEDLTIPTLVDIYISLLEEQELVVKAKKITLHAEEEVLIGSGETQTKFSGTDGRITTTAKHVSSSAEKIQKIQGSKVKLN
ncbi:hypothetical protein WOC09_22810 [Vibrio parahaemolyticus]|uniref:hypothetical protein n=1 Tax=Vibrio parahaemolyticus TaxID=670 RepID=UPI00132F03F8|nr:hypothetical protein [Vibrio parahaemolyticus]HDY7914220.1 hypothetical protein [Vibrio vulnificus]EJB8505776.1 hypothetical protein [Vibrio parahaemolyticus]MCR9866443.1 hypothetical protein [Vibrio parahaemolyticus]QHG92865.1 hypothetical protein EHC70_00730 [Vibrio parahaemolyticus]HCG9120377.1 hypothetical protein [Vibrio parahaemolyticus]